MVTKTAAMLCESLFVCPFGSSLSSDTAAQVTRMSLTHAQVSFHPLDVVTCFLLLGSFAFLFPPTRIVLSHSPLRTQVCLGTSVHEKVPKFKNNSCHKQVKVTYTFFFTACIAKPTTWKRGCGNCHSDFTLFKKNKKSVRLPARCFCFSYVSAHKLHGS